MTPGTTCTGTLKASVESATVAARGVAEASEAAGKAAPKLAGCGGEERRQHRRDHRRCAHRHQRLREAQTTWQKIKSALWLVAYGAAHAI